MKKDISNGNSKTGNSPGKKSRPFSENDAKGDNKTPGRGKPTSASEAQEEADDAGSNIVNGNSSAPAEIADDNSSRGENIVSKRAKTAKPNGQRNKPGVARPVGDGVGSGGSTQTDSARKQGQQTTMKPPANRLEPLDQPSGQNGSAGTSTPRSRGSDESDSERKVSFQERPADQGGVTVRSADQGGVTLKTMPPTTETRDRQNSLSKRRNGSEKDRAQPATARETFQSDLPRESPRHDGAVTWRKVNSDSMLAPRLARESRDPDALSDSGFSTGRCDQAWESSGRKFTRKSAKGNLG
ncbi:hypothetical protein PoB_003513900 [Plakobranchus ocellatus]|uniref:Uncharacterized protein n=1 Tax=Plakobranchus ocellatus TaxID=259542 RepID=A0AAV4AQN7_9GAST|nr:hypothetical protein PoB_003513900 [Plakobranchus ocellatus]